MFSSLQHTWKRDGNRSHFVVVNAEQNVGELPLTFIHAHGDDIEDNVYTIDRKDNCFSINLRIGATRAYLTEGFSELTSFYNLKNNYGIELQYVEYGIFYIDVTDEMQYHLDFQADPNRHMRHVLPKNLYSVVRSDYLHHVNQIENPIESDYELFLQAEHSFFNTSSISRSDSLQTQASTTKSTATSRNMEFTKCLKTNIANKSQLTFPPYFSAELFKDGTDGWWNISVHKGQQIQHFSCKLLKSKENLAKLGQGWKDLCNGCSLKTTDDCTFKIIDGPNRLMHMFINTGS